MSGFVKRGFNKSIDKKGREVYEKHGYKVIFDYNTQSVRFRAPEHMCVPGYNIPFGMIEECLRVIVRLWEEHEGAGLKEEER